jgi:predicted DNA repair protein MutK
MSTGLLALLDDIAGITKIAAASVDDIAAKAAKAGAKAAGVVIDDAAVTPRYVIGSAAARELTIVWRIALGSLKNKLVFLLPAALLLSAFAPWAITPLLVIGGAFLCYEGAEKVYEAIAPHAAHKHEAQIGLTAEERAAQEEAKIQGAIRTDFILSAEIMAITLSTVAASTLLTQAVVLAVVGVAITVVVYGAVALIVKADDAGLALAARESPAVAALGRGIVLAMPVFLKVLSVVGTAAMLWVGGAIVIHGLEEFGFHAIGTVMHAAEHAAAALVPAAAAFMSWLGGAVASGVFGLLLGAALIPTVEHVIAPAFRAARRAVGKPA